MRETRFPAHDVAFAAVWDERAPRVSTGSAPALVVRHSRRKMMATLALGLGIVPIAVAMGVTATGSDDRVAGFVVAAAGLCAVAVALRRLSDRSPQIVISDDGFLDHRLHIGIVPWTEISGASVIKASRQNFVTLQLRDPEMFLHSLSDLSRRLGRFQSSVGLGDLPVGCVGLDCTPEQIAAAILDRAAPPGAP